PVQGIDAHDLRQETLRRAVRMFSSRPLAGDQHRRDYILQIALNVWKNALRKAGREVWLRFAGSIEDLVSMAGRQSGIAPSASEVAVNETEDQLRKLASTKLDPTATDFLVLTKLVGCTVAEAAHRLELTPREVEAVRRRCQRFLRSLSAQGLDEGFWG